jgi:transposase InsO family protein
MRRLWRHRNLRSTIPIRAVSLPAVSLPKGFRETTSGSVWTAVAGSLIAFLSNALGDPVEHEELFLHSYQTVFEVPRGQARYFRFYNTERLHESMGYQTPYEIYAKEQGKNNLMQASALHLK